MLLNTIMMRSMKLVTKGISHNRMMILLMNKELDKKIIFYEVPNLEAWEVCPQGSPSEFHMMPMGLVLSLLVLLISIHSSHPQRIFLVTSQGPIDSSHLPNRPG